MGKHEDLRSLVHELRRHGFTQYRKTNHGWLYGFQEFRFHIPHSLTQGGHIDQVADAWARWQKLKTEVLGANPGLKLKATARRGDTPDVVDTMQPVQNIEDVLLDGGTAGEDSEAMNLAGEGSIPSPPSTETERPEPVDPSDALEGSTPSSLLTLTPQWYCLACDKLIEGPMVSVAGMSYHPNHAPNAEEITTMAVKRRKDGKRMPDPWTCPKCGKTFKQQGRHTMYCDGTAKPARAKADVNGRSKHGPVVTVKAGDYMEIFKQFSTNCALVQDALKALITERDHYMKERDDLAERLSKFDALRGLFK